MFIKRIVILQKHGKIQGDIEIMELILVNTLTGIQKRTNQKHIKTYIKQNVKKIFDEIILIILIYCTIDIIKEI